MGRHAASGALWTIICSVAGKVVTLSGHILLAWFLAPDDMGLVAMAMSIATIITLFASVGVQDVLVQRQKEFLKFAKTGFWLSLGLSTLGGLVIASIAPVAGMMFGEPRVVPLVLLTSLILPLNSFATIYAAKLYHDMRFKTVAGVQLASGVIQIGGAVPLAALGFGPYAIIIPRIIASGASPLLLRMATGRIAFGWPQLTHWRELLGPGLWLALFGLFNALRSQGMNLVLGVMRDSHITGLFFWGFQISSQFLYLLAGKLRQVLFPSLTRLNNEPARQFAAMQRAWRTLTLVAVPVCVLQAGLADSLIPLVFPEKWLGAIPVVQWLSIGMLTLPVHIVAMSVITAQGRFGVLAGLGAVQAVVMLSATSVGAVLGDQGAIAAASGLAMLVMNLLSGYVAVRCFGKSGLALIRSVGDFYLIAAATGLACYASRTIVEGPPLAALSVGFIVACGAYAVLVRCCAWDVVRGVVNTMFSARQTGNATDRPCAEQQ